MSVNAPDGSPLPSGKDELGLGRAVRRGAGSVCRCRSLVCAFTLISTLLVGSPKATAQLVPALAGGVVGAVAGGVTTLGIFVARSRAGNFIFDYGDVQEIRLETLPVVLFPLAGIVLGATDAARLRDVGIGAGLGLVVGGALGVALGASLSESSEGRWAGGIIGSAAGLVVGAVVGSLTADSGGGNGPSVSLASIQIPLGGVRR